MTTQQLRQLEIMTRTESFLIAAGAFLTDVSGDILDWIDNNPDEICDYAFEPLWHYTNEQVLDLITSHADVIYEAANRRELSSKMDYTSFLFSQLLREYNRSYDLLPYDRMFEAHTDLLIQFEKSKYNDETRSEYDCMVDFLVTEEISKIKFKE